MDPSSEVPKFRNRQEDPNDANSTCLEKAGLKQTTSDQEGQISTDPVKLESPLSPLALDIVSQKITARLKPENHGQSSGKVEIFVTPRSKHGRGLSLEENDLHRPFHSSLPDNSLRSGATTRSPHPGGTPRRTQRHNTDNDYSFEHSPATPHHGKVGGKGGLPASPFWERKVSSSTTQGFGFATPGRHQPKPVTYGAESPDNTPTVPKFGDWDESDPSAADRFTQVFDQVREQRQNGSGTRTATANGPSSQNRQRKFGNSSEGCCCFSWCKP
ncbi:unnamed protein product [Rhodiola kirilowii]